MNFSTSDAVTLYLAGAVSEALLSMLALGVWAAATRNPRTWGSVVRWALIPNLLLLLMYAGTRPTFSSELPYYLGTSLISMIIMLGLASALRAAKLRSGKQPAAQANEHG
jgi:hydrogenase/urease accessory protein HupE